VDNAYKVHMKLTINSVSPSDYGIYKCVSRNSLGDSDGNIKVYRKYNRIVQDLCYLIITAYLSWTLCLHFAYPRSGTQRIEYVRYFLSD